MAIQPFDNVKNEDFKIIQPYFLNKKTMDIDDINTIVLHWTAGASITSDVTTLKSKGYGYHFLIDKQGKIYQGAPATRKLSHAGNSYGPKGRYVNSYSIGISFSMLGTEGNNKFNNQQITACANLILDLKKSIPNLKYITGHHWISPGRKIDPYTFPFDEFIRRPKIKSAGFELWKTGYAPFPEKLDDCKCIKQRSGGGCKQSSGGCKGPGRSENGTRYGYSERDLSNEVSDLSFTSDLESGGGGNGSNK
jgi:N-acetyl-anhydromuramyl-L-alanine amidase AmpD